MTSVLISVNPKWCELSASGQKTLEIRKTRPKIKTPFKVYIYQTKFSWVYDTYRGIVNGQGKVIGEFVCDYILGHCEMANADIAEQQSLLKRSDILNYSNGKEVFGWHISDLIIYDKPKDLIDFYTICPEWDKEVFTAKCDKCQYYSEIYAEYRTECTVEGEKPITRAPQSWCYVEEE